MKIFNSIIKYSRVLEEVDLSYNSIDDEGIDIIAKNLGRNKGLKILYLKRIGITDESAKLIHHMLIQNKELRSLDLSDNTLTNEGFKEILSALEKNESLRHIDFSGNRKIDWSALKLIRNTQSKITIKKSSPQEFNYDLIQQICCLKTNQAS